MGTRKTDGRAQVGSGQVRPGQARTGRHESETRAPLGWFLCPFYRASRQAKCTKRAGEAAGCCHLQEAAFQLTTVQYVLCALSALL